MDNWMVLLLIAMVAVNTFFSKRSLQNAEKKTDVLLKFANLNDNENKAFEEQLKVQELHVMLARENAALLEAMDEKLNNILEQVERNGSISAEDVKKLINDADLVSELNQEIEVEITDERNVESK